MAPVKECGIVEGPVSASERHTTVLHLKIAAWSKAMEGTSEDSRDFFEAVHEGSTVDVVEWLGEEPVFFCIVDLEVAVWGNT